MTRHGGKRVGAGRKLGALAKRTQAIAEKASAEGITPLEVMLANMWHFHRIAESAEKALAELSADKIDGMEPDDQFKYLLAEVKKAAGLRDMAQGCAVDAAPYIHPKLASHTISGDPNAPLEVVHIIEHVVTSDSVHKIERARSDRVPATIEAGSV